ncbi:hypothetical protein MOK15_01700 [Sphingobium sp. BYY-5]|uniref:hypothetical protein n=1 Tax=Sphingobium sp. BYY-5 TaxID=2926400 RepID=UPI001FA76689|nr:hypothetical protein [Sphingobium sp. BYY-5]MCI4588824.1 hypothetical protein [Sphingobium sp. BYY-5]
MSIVQKHLYASVLALALGGCAQLPQAPLVYSSKLQVGLQLAAATADTPGTEFSFGMKSLDAAYVPVAVARPCARNQPCRTDLALIFGTNKVDNKDETSNDPVDRAYKDKQGAERAMQEHILAQANAQQAQEDTQKILDKARERDRINGLAAAATADDQVRLAGITTELGGRTTATLTNDFQTRQAEVNRLSGLTKTLEGNVSAKAKDYYEIATKFGRLAKSDDKRDALSVFGSFNTGVALAQNDNKPKLGLGIGKLFSTGVAAQNLTTGLGRASCLQTGKDYLAEVTAPADKADLAKKIVELCAATSRQQSQ